MDLANFPTGSVLDIVLHPSAVQGADGLHAFYGILKTYFKGFKYGSADFQIAVCRDDEKCNVGGGVLDAPSPFGLKSLPEQ